MELHTFSSLNEKFLKQYKDCIDEPDTAIVYFSPEAIANKKLEPITKAQVLTAFGRKDLLVFTDSERLEKHLNNLNWENTNLLMMSSGTFEGMNLDNLID
jgi:UDP-N-acetylmuramate: L-alanyl-gamma-D-glutamyl-meso-diaminopimelate ligase